MRKGLRKFEPYHWVVEAVGHKLATHHPVIEPVSAAEPGTEMCAAETGSPNPARVARKHDDVTRETGPYMANGSMRTLRAIYNHARKTHKSLPPDNPADA